MRLSSRRCSIFRLRSLTLFFLTETYLFQKIAMKIIISVSSPFPLKKARERIGYSEEEVANKLGIPVSGYKDREKGRVPVTLVECAQLTKLFELSFDEFNDIFFRSALPFRKEDSLPYNHIIPQKVGEINAEASNSSRV